MASKFPIDVVTPKSPRRPPRVRGLDDSMDESTGWLETGLEFRGQPDEVILAAACERYEVMRELLETAAMVSYMTCLNEDHRFDVHGFLESWPNLLKQFRLDQSLEKAKAAASPPALRF